MYGKATLDTPDGHWDGLSDDLAVSYGRIVARTLSDGDPPVRVTLESGKRLVIGNDALCGGLIFAWSGPRA